MPRFTSWPLILWVPAAAILIYAIVVLGFVATSPDLRLRTALTGEWNLDPDQPRLAGVPLVATSGARYKGVMPQVDDRLLRVGEYPVGSVIDLSRALFALRQARPGGPPQEPEDNLSQISRNFGLAKFVEVKDEGRWVEVEFYSESQQQNLTTWVQLQSVPAGSLLISLVWFLLQLSLFLVAGLAYWHRPFDRTSRVFFGMCIVTLGAYIGGHHWWLLAASYWLAVPFAVCGMLVPVVPLHFFLLFPRPRGFLQQARLRGTLAIYGLPTVAILLFLFLIARVAELHGDGAATSAELLQALFWLRNLIYASFAMSAVYFGLTLLAIWHGYRNVHGGIEAAQLRWFWYGGLTAAAFTALSLVIAVTRKTEFALGAAGVTMFLASLSFMVAYTVALVRYKLMLIEQIVSRNMLYYLASTGLTAALSLTIALSILVPQWLGLTLSAQQALMIAIVLALAVVLLLWLRDFVQEAIDRRFFREKYRLDRAIQQINQATEGLGDPQSVGRMLLQLCAEGIGVTRGLLYLQTEAGAAYRLAACHGMDNAPDEIAIAATAEARLRERQTVQRMQGLSTPPLPEEQLLLVDLETDLVHLLRIDEQVRGLVFLADKSPHGSYTAEDFAFLNALGQIANIALHSARVVDQSLSRLNLELQHKLEKIGDQQRHITALQAELTRLHAPTQPTSPAKQPTFQRGEFKGQSAAVLDVLETSRKVAASESSVLIRGESGTGKEVLARLLHENSPRKDGPLVRVNCAALSASLLESELFGHVKGAFTGADKDRIGRFELAHTGTLFLDEIGDISLETQVRLLRVLQERCFEPVGSTRTVTVDVRVVTATHQPLEDLIADGRFREDLFYRLNVISLTLPPLRERREDILELALHFLRQSATRQNKTLSHFDATALEALENYAWPGNVRELENVIERAVVLAEDNSVTVEELPAAVAKAREHLRQESAARFPRLIRHSATAPSETPAQPAERVRPAESPEVATTAAEPIHRPGGHRKPAVENPQAENTTPMSAETERQLLLDALQNCNGNKARAARQLGMPRSTYFSKLKKYDIV